MLPPFLRSPYTSRSPKSSKKWPLLSLLGLLISGCTIEGPERLIYLKEGEILVQRGDTLSSIAARHNVSVKALAECNNLPAPYGLNRIKTLKLPSPDGKMPTYGTPSTAPTLLNDKDDVQWTTVDEVSIEQGEKPSEKPSLVADGNIDLEETKDSEEEKDSELEGSLVGDTQKPIDAVNKKIPHVAAGWGKEPSAKPEKKAKKTVPFIHPVSGGISKKFKKGALGISFKAPKGTPVYAIADGTVVLSGPMRGDSSKVVVLIDHGGKWSSCYKKLEKSCISSKKQVKQGDLIGYSQGPDLPFELRDNRSTVNPEKHLK